jgi:hypothetical protein
MFPHSKKCGSGENPLLGNGNIRVTVESSVFCAVRADAVQWGSTALRESLETVGNRVGEWCEIAASLLGRVPGSKESSTVGRRYHSITWPYYNILKKLKTKLRGLSPRANYTDHHLSAKLVPTLAVRGCSVVSVTDPYGYILGFLDRSRYFFFHVALQLYSRGWVEPVPDPTSQKIW